MTLGRTAGAIKIKTDGSLRAVSCGCCICGPCPTLKGLMPTVGTPPQKPTSFNWEVTLSGASWIIDWNDDEPITTPSRSGIANVAELNSDGTLKYDCVFNPYIDPFGGVTYLQDQAQGTYGIFTLLSFKVVETLDGDCSFGISLYTSQEDDVLCSPPLRGLGEIQVSPSSFFGTHSINYTVNYYLCDGSTQPPTETLYRSWQIEATVTIS